MADVWDLAPVVSPRAGGDGVWSLAPVPGGTPVDAATSKSIADAIRAGFQSSSLGLALRGKLPDQQLGVDAPWYHRIGSAVGQIGGDLPAMVVGGVAGGVAGAGVGGAGGNVPGAIVGSIVGRGAGAFAAPMVIREALIEAYSKNHALSWSGVWEIAKAGMVGGGKGAVIGAVTGGAGALAERTAMSLVAPGVGTTITAQGATRVATSAGLGTELAALTTTSAALEGHMPTAQDFLDNALLLGGLKGAVHVATKLRAVYAETGKRPEEVLAEANADPALKAALESPEKELPSPYRELSTEQRIQAALDRDARPEAIRELMMGSKDPAELGRPLKTGDPVDYSYITDSGTLRGVLPAVEKMFEREITTQTRGEVTNKAAAADAIRRIAAGDVAQHIIGTAENNSQILARGMLLRGASERAFNELRQHAGKSEADLTLTDKLGSLAAIEQLGMFLAEFRGVRAEAGRALQIFKALKRDPSLVADAEAIVKLYERKGSLTEIAQMVAQLKDPTQMQKFAESYQKATTMEMVIEGWKAAILSGPLTHLANLLGNGMKWTLDIPESMISASLLAAGRALKGDPLSMAQWKARAFAPLYGLQHGAVEAVHVAAEVWRGKGERLEKADVYRTAIPGTAGEVIRLPFKALQIEDALFRTVAERSRAHTMAVDRAVKEGYDLRTREGREAVAQYTERPDFGLSEKAGAEAVAAVQQAGAEAVFSQRLGPRMEIAQRAIAGHWTQFVVPFVRTPANLVSWAIQHTPGLNLLSGRWRADFAAGGERQAQAIARVTIGTGLAMWAYSQAADGLLTGGGLFDPETRRTKAAAGWQPYSVKVGDTHYSYQRLEPLAKVLGLAADLVELSNRSTKEEDKAKIATMLILMFGNATISTTYLSGLANATQALLDPARHAGGLLEQYASSLVPKIIGQATQLADPYKREVDGVVDAIQSQIPFLREKLLPKRDVWGEPMKNERLFEVLPLAASAETTEKVKSEAMRLAIGIQDAPRFVMEAGPFNPKDKRMKLEPEQRDIMREVSGKTAMSLLSPIVNSPDWARIPDFAKIEIYRDILKGARKQGEYAALPPDSAARMALRQKIADRVLREAQAAQGQ